MPTHSEHRPMPHSPEQMFALVADIAKYPEFLPWCTGARIRSTREIEGGSVVDADLIISFKLFRERFTSRVTMHPDTHKIEVEYLDGPFKHLVNYWHFVPTDSGCIADFHVDFEFKSKVLQAVIGVVFTEAMRRIVRAFEDRASALYGPQKQL
ncbi:MAG: type II toxin-antitoxin system RatA family toxin [Rhodobacteraceae bacterium]|nr:type II toxin-antitoxin system RatA family toxin [Paracoccaceae bacterium]